MATSGADFAYVGASLRLGYSKLGKVSDPHYGQMTVTVSSATNGKRVSTPPGYGLAFVGQGLQLGISRLGQTHVPHLATPIEVTVSLADSAGRSIRVGRAAPLIVTMTVAQQGHRIIPPYRPEDLKLMKVVGGALVGSSLKVGVSKLGQTYEDLAEVRDVSSIELTDGYEVNGDVLSIDPLTGSATISHRIHPTPADRVEEIAGQHDMYAGESWEIRYGDTIVAQGIVLQVETQMASDDQYWIKRTKYVLGGSASRWLADMVSWDALPEEGALTRLSRFFREIDTALLTSPQRDYLDSVLAPAEEEPGTASLLDLARAFTEQTLFPVRTANNLAGESSAMNLVVIPAVKFQGVMPQTLYMPPASTWTLDGQFLSDEGRGAKAEKVQTVDVIKNFDLFISGVGKQALIGGQLGLTFTLGASRVGNGGQLSVDVGVRTPAVVNLFGRTKVISQINHEFTGTYYRSSLELTEPAEVTSNGTQELD